METGAWVEAVKIECEDRLGNYWLPRFKHRGQRSAIISIYAYSCDSLYGALMIRSVCHLSLKEPVLCTVSDLTVYFFADSKSVTPL